MSAAKDRGRGRERIVGALALVLAVLALGRWTQVSLALELSASEGGDESGDANGPPPPPPPSPYLPAARALLDGLETGQTLAPGWTVARIEGPIEEGKDAGSIRVVCRRQAQTQTLSLWLRPKGIDERPAPMHSERWDLFYDRPNPPEPKLDRDSLGAMMQGLIERVRANEG